MYAFPYHYLVDFDATGGGEGFSQCRNLFAGFRYASYALAAMQELDHMDFRDLIDVGCGDGFFLRKLAERFPDRHLTGVDLSEKAVALARLLNGTGESAASGIEFLCQDILRDPLDRQFDVALSIHVLEHIPPDLLDGFLATTAGLLRPGGTFLVQVPSTCLSIRNITRHYRHFDAASLTDALSPHFAVRKVEYLNRSGVWNRLFRLAFANPLCILNSRRLLDGLFRLYMRHFLHCAKPNGLTLMAACTKE